MRARNMPTTMITVPKITLPPSSVIWNSKAATLSPPSLPRRLDGGGEQDRGHGDGADDARRVGARRHDAERADDVVEAEARQHGFDHRLDPAADEEGDRQPDQRRKHARDGECDDC